LLPIGVCCKKADSSPDSRLFLLLGVQFRGRRRLSYRTLVRQGAVAGMSTFERVVAILKDTLQLGEKASALQPGSALLGGLPEFDSMAVVTVVTMIEDELGITIDDDELSADTFATVGGLAEFLDRKLVS
jgi:acyl carrier protein